eukprot:GHVO01050107.1.p1 GENE.GHVO01050107.1~~GHVO01050107.1.p1  ORF type:complete len:108 (-),score=16.15 GHVO01050107.1:81-404(-)
MIVSLRGGLSHLCFVELTGGDLMTHVVILSGRGGCIIHPCHHENGLDFLKGGHCPSDHGRDIFELWMWTCLEGTDMAHSAVSYTACCIIHHCRLLYHTPLLRYSSVS